MQMHEKLPPVPGQVSWPSCGRGDKKYLIFLASRPFGLKHAALTGRIGAIGRLPAGCQRMFRRSGHRFADKNMRQAKKLVE